eukprot:3362279-Alexandrium_andersonii.AAC.1
MATPNSAARLRRMRWGVAQAALSCPSTSSLMESTNSNQEKPSPVSTSRTSLLQSNQEPSAWLATAKS